MKRNKYSLLLVAAIVCMGVWASIASDGKKKKAAAAEKVRPAANLMAQQAPKSRQYAKIRPESIADGIPYGLSLLDVSNKAVQLSWLSPEQMDGIFDDFESHADFEINSSGSIGWSYVDADNVSTYTWQACSFPNQGQKMAFIVMNPSKTSPAVNENPDIKPFSGQKMLVDFCAVDAQNNDFLISPELNFERNFQVSFMARSYKISDNIPAERIRVGYSTTGKQPSDFTYVTPAPYVELPARWTPVKYMIPKEAKYVAINCVSNGAFMLLIDDIFIGTNEIRPSAPPVNPVVGFNVYRNGTKVNTTPVSEVRFTDNVDDYGTYDYTVSALRKDGTESAQSSPLRVEVPDVRLLPFFDDFDDWTLHPEKWTTEQGDGTTESRWGIDYFTYGLIDPSATYAWSKLTNYDQSLVTTELHTLDLANTYLRFNLRLHNSQRGSVDYLTLEASSDGGNTWRELETYNNSNGAFYWSAHQFDLGQFLTGNLFKIRFRAHGTDATWINYWYVDDVKIWNPVWTTARLNVSSSSGSMSNTQVTLTADHGAVINATTDASGNIDFPKIEVGKYTVEIVHDGYNIYKGVWDILDGATNNFTAQLTQPVPTLSETTVQADIPAESNTTKTLTISNTGDGPLVWYLKDKPALSSGNATERWKPQGSFSASGDLQQSIVFDGQYYYTSSSVQLGKFWKYDTSGVLLEQFDIPGMYYRLYDMTFDGRYFYGSDFSNRLFKLDFENRRVAGVIDIPSEPDLKITHCSYDPDRNGFWVGSFGSIGFIDRQGNIRSRFTSFDNANSVSVFGSAYDNVSPGGPYLWLADMTSPNANTIDKILIRQYSLVSRSLTQERHVLSDAPGYRMGNATSGENYVCGLFTSTDIVPGQLTLVGTLNQSPNLVFKYKLCETNNWLSVSPKRGIIQPGSQQIINVAFDALSAKNGDAFQTRSLLMTLPELPEQEVNFKLNATSPSPAPRPQELKATAGSASVALEWKQATGATAQSYNVYRNDVKINSQPVTRLTYQDTHLVYGPYVYKVTAVYPGNVESAKSDSVSTFVKDGAQYYPPKNIQASISRNRNVHIDWQSPLADVSRRDTMSWANGKHEDQLGVGEGGAFYAGSEWQPADLTPYRNKLITSVAVQLVNPCTYLALHIMKDGQEIYQRTYNGQIYYDGTFTAVPVEPKLVVEPGHTYLFAFRIMNEAGVQPLSIDDSEAVNGKGNLLSEDGQEWFAAAQSGIPGNFNIRVNLEPNPNQGELAPTGYNVYRNGTKINTSTVTARQFDDVLSAPGIHTYSLTSVYSDGGESAQSQRVNVESKKVEAIHAPKAVNAAVEKNRDVSLRWDYPTAAPETFPADLLTRPVTTAPDCPEYISAFVGRKSEMAIVSDGQSIYTSIYNEDGIINKYTLAGQFVTSYKVEGLKGIRNLAYDGENLYAADNTTNIHKLDIPTMRVLATLPISEYSRHIAYIPTLDGGKGGFEVGDWQTSIYIRKDGSKISTGPSLLGAAGTAHAAGKLYAFEQGNQANAHTIGIYDLATGKRINSIDMSKYLEIDDMASVRAGGMSSFTSADGITYILMALQRQGENTQFAIIDATGIGTVEGYNIYRDGQKLNAEPIERRHFAERISQEGEYDYTVQTVYVDGSLSAQSPAVHVTIIATGQAKTPANVQAQQSTYGYNVLLSFADPDMHKGAASLQSFETFTNGTEAYRIAGETYPSNWTATNEQAFDGIKSIKTHAGREAFAVINATGMKHLRMALRNADDHNGRGTLNIYYSTGGTNRANFIFLQSYNTTEAWQDILCQLPQGTEYVAIAAPADAPVQYADAIALYSAEPQSELYGFDIYRNGTKITPEPVNDISYTDHNLLPGKYEYQVRLITKTSAESELSDKITLDYDNGGLPPTNFTATFMPDNQTKLSWMYPALGTPIYLRWHDGNSFKAAGLPSGGAFFAGAQWFANDLRGYQNSMLTDVEVYINQLPEALFLLVYENNTLVRQQFVRDLKQYDFNTLRLDEPLKIDPTKNLRVAVYVEHTEIAVPLGYDRGPARSGRGDLFSRDGITWSSIKDSGTEIDANWNISIGLSPYSSTLPGKRAKRRAHQPALPAITPAVEHAPAPVALKSAPTPQAPGSQKNVFQGYNVYRNGERINTALTTDTTFIDTKPYADRYLEYQVSAVYSTTGEQFSNKVTLVVSGIGSITGSDGIRIQLSDGRLTIFGARVGSSVSITHSSGTLVARSTVADTYAHHLQIPSLTPGTYIIKVGTSHFKVQVTKR